VFGDLLLQGHENLAGRNFDWHKHKRPTSPAQCRPMISPGMDGPKPIPVSIQALALGHVARNAAQVTLDRSCALALALLGRLFVELALADFGEDAGLLAGTLETAERELKWFVLADFDAWHKLSGRCRPRASGEPHILS